MSADKSANATAPQRDRVRLWDIGYGELQTLRTMSYALMRVGFVCEVEPHPTEGGKLAVFAEKVL